MEEATDEIQRLQACINDLISVLAIPAVWSGREPAQIASTLLDVLLRILRLDFAYARLEDPLGGVPIEIARVAQYRELTPLPQAIGQALNPWLEDDPTKWPLLVRNPIAEGNVSIVPLRLGLQNKIGIIVAGAQRADFPAETERLLLRIAANQAAIALQEARDHNALDRLVAERTEKLARANESLHRSETYLAEAQRLSHTGSWSFNVATREIVHWSQEHFRIFGFDPEDGIPSFETLMQRIHPDDRATAAEVIEIGIRERTDYEQDFRIVLPNGTTRYMHAIGHPVFNSSGDPVEFMGTVIDVTESKRAEEALRSNAQNSRLIIDSIPGLVCTMTGAGELELINRQVLEYHGKTFEELKNWAKSDAVHPHDISRVTAAWKASIETGEPYDIEHRIRRADGVYRWFHVRAGRCALSSARGCRRRDSITSRWTRV